MQVLNLSAGYEPCGPSTLTLASDFVFPGGEVGVKVAGEVNGDVAIVARITCSNDIMRLLMAADAVQRLAYVTYGGPVRINLYLPYMPYGRQDRVVEEGEAFSLAVFAQILRSASFASISTLDAHSDVQQALFAGVPFISHSNVPFVKEVLARLPSVRIVAPDAGAAKKVGLLTRKLGITEKPLQGLKYRVSGGKIDEVILGESDLHGRDLLVDDDICDGGATFIALTKALKDANAGRVYLACTHAIFSKGIDVLVDAGIEHVYCTDSYKTHEQHPKLSVIKTSFVI